MEQPEGGARHGIVIARVAKVQEPQHVLVHEVEPEEAAIFTNLAMKREIERGRIAQRSEKMPGHCDREGDQDPATDAEPLPCPVLCELPSDCEIEQRGGDRNNGSDQ